MRRFIPLLLAMLLGAVVPVLAVSESAPDEAEHNRRLLDQYRTEPDHYARLLRDLRAFQALPPEKQERMRQFDRELYDEDTATQNRLLEALELYTDWVNRLPEDAQKRIEQAPDRNARLAIVTELRQKDWVDRLPRKDREELLALPPKDQPARLAELRQKERQRRQAWADWAAAQKVRPASALPPVPWTVLRDFAKGNELTRQEKASLNLAGLDKNEKREVLTQEYFKKHPDKVDSYRRQEQRHGK